MNSDEPLKLETRARWAIPNEFRRERPRVALAASVELFRKLRPRAFLRSISSTYNCAGMVVANRRVIVMPEHLERVFADDGYRRLGGPNEAEIGDVVVYRDEENEICHVGLVAAKIIVDSVNTGDSLRVLSKWGADGEYLHDVSDIPEALGRPSEYWTDRKESRNAR